MATISLLKTAFTTGDYYKAMNKALKSINGDYQMLHYPYYINEIDNFIQAQKNLIEYCVNQISTIEYRTVLDLGCGNGVVAMYLAENYNVKKIIGVDLNKHNVDIANEEKRKRNVSNIDFIEDDAQNLSKIQTDSVDVVINIESAFHYPNKPAFLKEIHRVLKPGGQFMIADIITTRKGSPLLKKWKHKMNFHHWSLDEYKDAFNKSALKLQGKIDISDNVIKGFEVCRNFLNNFKLSNFLGRKILQFFFYVNIKLNIYLLRKKRRYYIFYGINESVS